MLFASGCAKNMDPIASPTASNSTLFTVAEKVSQQKKYADISQACKFDVANSSVSVASMLEEFLSDKESKSNFENMSDNKSQDRADLQQEWLEHLQTQNETNLSLPKSCTSAIAAGMLSIETLSAMSKVISNNNIKNVLEDFVYVMCKQASFSLQGDQGEGIGLPDSCSTFFNIYESRTGSPMQKMVESLYGNTEN